MVSPETMNSSIRIIHGPTWRRPAPRQRAQPRLGLGAHREVVVDDRGLAVEQEPRERRVALEEVEQVVDEVHELHPVALERRVPLAVPVRVRDDAHATSALLRPPPVLPSPGQDTRWYGRSDQSVPIQR